jgi:hypothetical protein
MQIKLPCTLLSIIGVVASVEICRIISKTVIEIVTYKNKESRLVNTNDIASRENALIYNAVYELKEMRRNEASDEKITERINELVTELHGLEEKG